MQTEKQKITNNDGTSISGYLASVERLLSNIEKQAQHGMMNYSNRTKAEMKFDFQGIINDCERIREILGTSKN